VPVHAAGSSPLHLLGISGCVYEVTWTRLLTLSWPRRQPQAWSWVRSCSDSPRRRGGRRARGLTRRAAIRAYALLELAVAAVAVLLPAALVALTPLLRWAYDDAAPGLAFPLVRIGLAVTLVLLPALALGATFPLAIRWFASDSPARTRRAAMLYATNTLGAAAGALLAGFVLIPRLGVTRAIFCGVAASVVSAAIAWRLSRAGNEVDTEATADTRASTEVERHRATVKPSPWTRRRAGWLAAGVLGLSGFAALLHGSRGHVSSRSRSAPPPTRSPPRSRPSSRSAAGSWIGAWLVGRVRQPALWPRASPPRHSPRVTPTRSPDATWPSTSRANWRAATPAPAG
jgi:hypothetical protein